MNEKVDKALDRLIGVLPLKEKQENCGARIKQLHQQMLRSFVDEPFGAVDYQMRHNLQEAFEDLWHKSRKPVVMVTHDAQEAVYLSDRILIMSADRGAIAHDMAVNLPRPRKRSSGDYHDHLARLTGLLKNLQPPDHS